MPSKNKKLSEGDMNYPTKNFGARVKKYQEIARVYDLLYKELAALEGERKELKKKVRGIIDKVKTKNILEEIAKKP